MIHRVREMWGKIRKDSLARDSSWMFLGNILRIGLQAIYFVVVARFLGVKYYGIFVAVAAIAAIVSPFSALGAGNILMKKVAREPAYFAEAWGQALFLAASTGAILTAGTVLVAHLVLPSYISLETVLLITLADLLGPRLAELGAMAFGAFGQFRWNATLVVSISGFRAVAAVLMVAFYRHPTIDQWIWFYMVSSVLMSIFALCAVLVKLGKPVFRFTDLWEDAKEGAFFSLSTSAQTIYNDIDKTMLSRLSTASAVGLYGAAYRIIDLGTAPLRSITAASYPSFFREGQKGFASSWRLAGKVFTRGALITGAMCVGMAVFAPLMPRILGSGYQDSVEALWWLTPLPLLKCMHVVLGDALTGAGYQRVRAAMQVFIALFNVGINFWLIRAYSWRGACWSSLASDGLLAAMVLVCGLFLRDKEAEEIASNAND